MSVGCGFVFGIGGKQNELEADIKYLSRPLVYVSHKAMDGRRGARGSGRSTLSKFERFQDQKRQMSDEKR